MKTSACHNLRKIHDGRRSTGSALPAMQIARQGALRSGRRRSCGRGDQREQRPRLTRCPRGRCSCRVLLSKRSTCTRGHALPSMSAAWRARPAWNGGAGGAEAEAILAPTRRLHDAQEDAEEDEEDDASLEGLLCESEDRLCRKLQDMQARGLDVQAVVRKSDLPRERRLVREC